MSVSVALRDGSVAEFPDEAAARAFLAQAGERALGLDTPELARERYLQRELGTPGMQVAGAVSEAADQVLGGIPGIVEGVQDPAAAAAREEWRRINPGSSATGQVAGAVGGAALGAGIMRAAPAARAGLAVVPGAGMAAVAEGVGQGVTRALVPEGAGLARTILGRTAGIAAEGAADLALIEGSHVVAESALGDPNLTAEQAFTRIGRAGLTGATFGAAMGVPLAGASVSGRLLRHSADAIARTWSERMGTNMHPIIARAIALADGGHDVLPMLRRGGPEAREALEVLAAGRIDSDGFRRALEDAIASSPREAAIEAADAARLWDGDFAQQLGLVDRQLAGLRAVLGDHPALRQAERELAEALRGAGTRTLVDAAEPTRISPAPARTVVDEAAGRTAVDLTQDAVTRADSPSVFGGTPAEQRAASGRIYSMLDRLERDLRGVAATDGLVSAMRDTKAWGEALTRQHREAADAFSRLQRAQQQLPALSELVANAGLRPDVERPVVEFLDAYERAQRFTPIDPAGATGVGGTGAARRQLPELVRRAGYLNQYNAAVRSQGNVRQVANALGNAAWMGAVAGVPGAGLLGAAAGAAGIVANRAQLSRAVAVIRRLIEDSQGDIQRAVAGILGHRVVKGARTAAAVSARAGRRGGIEGMRLAFREERERLVREGDPMRAVQTLSEQTRGLERVPRVRQAMQIAAVRGDMFLRNRLPPGRNLPGTLVPDRNRLPSDQEVTTFLRYADAVHDPAVILDEMEHGKLTRESAEVLRNVYPALFRHIQEQVVRELADPDADPPVYRQRLQLGILLGVATDPSLSPDILGTIQGSHSQAGISQFGPNGTQAQGQGAPQTPPQLSGSAASDSDRLTARRS